MTQQATLTDDQVLSSLQGSTFHFSPDYPPTRPVTISGPDYFFTDNPKKKLPIGAKQEYFKCKKGHWMDAQGERHKMTQMDTERLKAAVGFTLRQRFTGPQQRKLWELVQELKKRKAPYYFRHPLRKDLVEERISPPIDAYAQAEIEEEAANDHLIDDIFGQAEADGLEIEEVSRMDLIRQVEADKAAKEAAEQNTPNSKPSHFLWNWVRGEPKKLAIPLGVKEVHLHLQPDFRAPNVYDASIKSSGEKTYTYSQTGNKVIINFKEAIEVPYVLDIEIEPHSSKSSDTDDWEADSEYF